MKTIQQPLRRPVRAIAGILIVLIAAAALSIGAQQSITARSVGSTLEYQFSTVALPTKKYNIMEYSIGDITISTIGHEMPEEVKSWIEQTVAANPEVVKSDSKLGLISAYIPALTPDNETQHDFFRVSQSSGSTGAYTPSTATPYDRAILEILLDDINGPEEYYSDFLLDDGTTEERFMGYKLNLTGKIQDVLLLQEGFDDPTGRTIYLSIVLPDLPTYEKLELSPGRRYLVYGAGYTDNEWELRGDLKENLGVEIDAFDLTKLTYFSEKQIEQNKQLKPFNYAVARYKHNYSYIDLTASRVKKINSVSLSLSASNINIALLSGGASEFLDSGDGAAWRQKLAEGEINNHGFPVIGVEKLGHIGNFAQETARIVLGRDFARDELAEGANVCVIAQSLAEANGLSVGDTLSLQYYNYDPETPGQSTVSNGWATTNPAAYYYGPAAGFSGPAEEYTIVGLYRCDNEWGDPQENLYSFTPNTIFVPKNSVTGTMDYGDQAFFRTIVLEHGAIPQFQQLVEDAGYEGLFVYYDQGYSEIADSLHDYEASARLAATIGAIVSGVLLLLFLFFFPARHGKTLAIMASLGATRVQRYRYIVADTLCLLIPGTVLGCVAGLLLWKQVAAKLMSAAQFTLDVPSSAGSLLPSVLALFLFTHCLVLLLAIPLSKGKHPMKRK